MNHNINAAAVTAAAQGQWRDVLTANGINLPSGRHHGACPLCMAGKDRFRFDDKEGRGTWVDWPLEDPDTSPLLT
ncbi:primase-helicase zinc-binding domain-containing protein [Aeromonas caviae]